MGSCPSLSRGRKVHYRRSRHFLIDCTGSSLLEQNLAGLLTILALADRTRTDQRYCNHNHIHYTTSIFSQKANTKMAPKRPIEDNAAESQPKKRRDGFKIGPDNLPDGTHRRKGTTTRQSALESSGQHA